MRQKNVYLCGAITHDEETWAWRFTAEEWFRNRDIEVLNPMRGKDLKSIKDNGFTSNIKGPHFTARDFADVRFADAIFANFLIIPERQMVGSLMELGYAYSYNVPIVLVATAPEFVNHPFLTVTTVDIVPSLEEGMEIVRFLLM